MSRAARIHRDDMERGQSARDAWLAVPTPISRTTPEEQARLDQQAKTFPVTRLPYMGERHELKFDRKKLSEEDT
jgi:hypothetical protein